MGYAAKVLADSVAPNGVRLTTLEVTFPRIVLSEFNTHRMLSRNSASSRAIPVEKRIEAVRADPFVPEVFAANKRGMQAGEELDRRDNEKARDAWKRGLDGAITAVEQLLDQGIHKQWANRLLEPFSWQTVIVTATEWENFFALRCSPEAQPEIRRAAELMREAMAASMPRQLRVGEWHTPLIQSPDDLDLLPEHVVKVSVARCARVSYLTHDGRRDVDADLALYDRLLKSGHISPFEHAAKVGDEKTLRNDFGHWDSFTAETSPPMFVGNFRAPWIQHRKELAGEDVFRG